MVAVAPPTVLSGVIACRTAGTRYASDFPVPVPAWTARCSPVSMARCTACAMATCPGRSAPPMPATAAARRSATSGTALLILMVSMRPGTLGLPGVLGLVLAAEVLGSLGTGGDFRLRPGGTSERYRVQPGAATTPDSRPGRRGVSGPVVRVNFSFDFWEVRAMTSAELLADAFGRVQE